MSPAFALQWAAASEGLASPGSCLWHSRRGQAQDLTALRYTTALHLPTQLTGPASWDGDPKVLFWAREETQHLTSNPELRPDVFISVF